MTDEVKIKKPHKPIWWYIATWFGAGTLPISGTMGSLAALPFAYVIQVTLGNFALFAASIIIFLIGWWAAEQFVRKLPEKGGDPKEVVVDEVAGQWLLLSVLYPTWHSYIIGFFLFRFFDILKPWPVHVADEKIKGGFGVMFDDMLAALYPILVYVVIQMIALSLDGINLLKPITNFLAGSYVH